MITFVITFRLHPTNINKNWVHTDTFLYFLNYTVYIDINKKMDKKNIQVNYACIIKYLHAFVIKYFANNADPDPSAPLGAFWSGLLPFHWTYESLSCMIQVK